jgi:TetR/AcrR family fatty acid metabolism transcriptional regulator
VATSNSDKRAKILEVALKIFTELGYHETKLDEIARQAGVAKGTLYLYFKNKADIFVQCMFDGYEKWMQEVQEIIDSDGSAYERLHTLVQLQTKVFTHSGPLIQQYIQSGEAASLGSSLAKKVMSRMRKRLKTVAGFFEQGIKSGEFSDALTPMQMAILFHQTFDLNMKFQLFEAPTISSEKFYELLLALFKARKNPES